MAVSPAPNAIAKTGIPRQTLIMITENLAQKGVPSQEILLVPIWVKIQFKTLKEGSNIHCQMSTLIEVGITQGSRTMALNTFLPMGNCLRRRARVRPRTVFSNSEIDTYKPEFAKVRKNTP